MMSEGRRELQLAANCAEFARRSFNYLAPPEFIRTPRDRGIG
jgi:hypothetical protein